jgi:hypothetical protein
MTSKKCKNVFSGAQLGTTATRARDVSPKRPNSGKSNPHHGFDPCTSTKKPELDSGLSATFYTENYTKASLDAAPQIYACQPHTVRLLRFGIVNVMNIAERLSPACHQFW